jgi:predicted transcriptional regulator
VGRSQAREDSIGSREDEGLPRLAWSVKRMAVRDSGPCAWAYHARPTKILVDTTNIFVDIPEHVPSEEAGSMASRQGVPEPNRPTDAELAILNVLWERGPSTVREVHAALSDRQGSGYTTVLKLLQIMTEKGLVVRDESQRAHVYASRLGEQRTQRQLLGDLVDRAFGGSPGKLVMQALSDRRATDEELREIRAMLDRLEKGEPR